MLCCHAYNASHASDARDPCVRRANGMEVGGRQGRHALLRSRDARCDQDRIARRTCNDRRAFRVLHASPTRAERCCGTALSQLRDFQSGARSDDPEHRRCCSRQCADRTRLAQRTHSAVTTGWTAGSESWAHHRFPAHRRSARHAYCEGRDSRPSRSADSRNEYRAISCAARVDCESTGGTCAAQSTEAAPDLQQVAEFAALLRCIERQADPDRSRDEYAGEISAAAAASRQALVALRFSHLGGANTSTVEFAYLAARGGR